LLEAYLWMDQKIKQTECFNTVVGGKCTQILYTKLKMCVWKIKLSEALSGEFFILSPWETDIGVCFRWRLHKNPRGL